MKRRLLQADIAATGQRLFALGSRWWRVNSSRFRALTGEDAYERYLAHLRAAHPGREPMSQSAFYRQFEEQKWDGIKRCC